MDLVNSVNGYYNYNYSFCVIHQGVPHFGNGLFNINTINGYHLLTVLTIEVTCDDTVQTLHSLKQ